MCHVVEARDEVDERGLPRARGSEDGDRLTRPCGKGHAREDVALAAGVPKRDVVEIYPAGDGEEDGGVGGILYVEGGVEDVEDPLGGGPCARNARREEAYSEDREEHEAEQGVEGYEVPDREFAADDLPPPK